MLIPNVDPFVRAEVIASILAANLKKRAIYTNFKGQILERQFVFAQVMKGYYKVALRR